MSDSPWFPFYAGDFISSTAHYSPDKIGVYVRLLAHQWLVGMLPLHDKRELCRVAGVFPDELGAYLEMISEKFPDGLNPRLEKEKELRETRRQNGKQGGRPKAKAKLNGKLNGKLKESESEPNTKGSQSQSQSHKPTPLREAPAVTEPSAMEQQIAAVLACFNIETPVPMMGNRAMEAFLAQPQFLTKEGVLGIKQRAAAWMAQDWITDVSPLLVANNLAEIYNFNPTAKNGTHSKGTHRNSGTAGTLNEGKASQYANIGRPRN
jgi:uncharacterized protein YdaU (DUF1376 family)